MKFKLYFCVLFFSITSLANSSCHEEIKYKGLGERTLDRLCLAPTLYTVSCVDTSLNNGITGGQVADLCSSAGVETESCIEENRKKGHSGWKLKDNCEHTLIDHTAYRIDSIRLSEILKEATENIERDPEKAKELINSILSDLK